MWSTIKFRFIRWMIMREYGAVVEPIGPDGAPPIAYTFVFESREHEAMSRARARRDKRMFRTAIARRRDSGRRKI